MLNGRVSYTQLPYGVTEDLWVYWILVASINTVVNVLRSPRYDSEWKYKFMDLAFIDINRQSPLTFFFYVKNAGRKIFD